MKSYPVTEDSLLSAMERAGADKMPDVGSARTGVATETAECKGRIVDGGWYMRVY